MDINSDRAPKNLDKLADAMKTFVASKRQGIEVSRPVLHPSKVCDVCSSLFGNKAKPEALQKSRCKSCVKSLEEGYTALVCDLDHRFIKSPELPGGKIIFITRTEMDALLKVEEQRKEAKDATGKQPELN